MRVANCGERDWSISPYFNKKVPRLVYYGGPYLLATPTWSFMTTGWSRDESVLPLEGEDA